jgi:putative PIN family toxin of toxin-antitoxin system
VSNFFVFDTNSLISASIVEGSIHAKAFDHARRIGRVVRSDESFAEFVRTLSKPKFDRYLSPARKAEAIARYRQSSVRVLVKLKLDISRDPDDNKILSLALAVGAACLITKDKDLLDLNPFRGMPIVPASKFLEMF